jgi:hypothetical protein
VPPPSPQQRAMAILDDQSARLCRCREAEPPPIAGRAVLPPGPVKTAITPGSCPGP